MFIELCCAKTYNKILVNLRHVSLVEEKINVTKKGIKVDETYLVLNGKRVFVRESYETVKKRIEEEVAAERGY